MIKNLLVPLDGSSLDEYVLPHAVAMAKAFDAQIYLLKVLEQPTASLRMPNVDPLDWHLKKMEANAYLATLKDRLDAISQLTVTTALVEGRAADQIVGFAQTHEVDLLILNSHIENETNGWAVSSPVQLILQRLRLSALIVPEHHSPDPESLELQYEHLIVPLDGSARAGSALPLATAIAKANEAELLLAHVVTKPEMARLMPLTPEENELITRFVERNQEEGNKYLDRLQTLANNDVQVQTRLLVSDNVASTIQSLCEQEQIDLVVMSAHGYSGEAERPFGGLTGRFITEGKLPLLIVQDQPHEYARSMEDVMSNGHPGR
jgi:nucleotide-binding universal stress UspA family protein